MEKLKLVVNGIVKKIEYTDKYATGIFLVTTNKQVKNNCKLLDVHLDDNIDHNVLQQKVTKLEKTGILTIKILEEHLQYIVKDYADKLDVERLVNEIHPKSREALRTAFNLTKINDLEDLGLLGGALDKKN